MTTSFAHRLICNPLVLRSLCADLFVVSICQCIRAQSTSALELLGRGVNFGNMLESPREGECALAISRIREQDAGVAKNGPVVEDIRSDREVDSVGLAKIQTYSEQFEIRPKTKAKVFLGWQISP